MIPHLDFELITAGHYFTDKEKMTDKPSLRVKNKYQRNRSLWFLNVSFLTWFVSRLHFGCCFHSITPQLDHFYVITSSALKLWRVWANLTQIKKKKFILKSLRQNKYDRPVNRQLSNQNWDREAFKSVSFWPLDYYTYFEFGQSKHQKIAL